VSDSANSAAMERGLDRPASATPLQRAVPGRRVLMIVENLPCPFDRRVMQEARTLAAAGYAVSIICPKAPGYEKGFADTFTYELATLITVSARKRRKP